MILRIKELDLYKTPRLLNIIILHFKVKTDISLINSTTQNTIKHAYFYIKLTMTILFQSIRRIVGN